MGYKENAVVNALAGNRPFSVVFVAEGNDIPAGTGEGQPGQNDNSGGEADEGEAFDMGSFGDSDFFTDSEGNKITVKQVREQQAQIEALKAQLAESGSAGKGKGSEQSGTGKPAGDTSAKPTDIMGELVQREAAREIMNHLKEFPLLDPEDVFDALRTTKKQLKFDDLKGFMKELHESMEKRFDQKNSKYIEFKKQKSNSSSSAEDINETGKSGVPPKIDKNKINLSDVDSIAAAFTDFFDKK